MSDSLGPVRAGEPFRPRASQFSRIHAATRWAETQMNRTGAGDGGGGGVVDPTIVSVKNSSGSDVAQLGVLGISGVVFTPADSENQFKSAVFLTGTTPTLASYFDKFVVAAEPIPNGKIGRAYIAGIFPAKINIVSADDEWANVEDSTLTRLKSAAAGAVRILYKPSGTGDLLCYVAMANPIARTFWVKVTGNATGGGKYNGRILTVKSSAPALTGDLAETDFGTVPSADNCYVLNSAEVGKSTHDLTAETPVAKMFCGYFGGRIHTDGKPFININGVDWENC